jgi:hypothetical protein
MDTHDKTKGSVRVEELTEEQFAVRFDALGAAGSELGVFAHAAQPRERRRHAAVEGCPSGETQKDRWSSW